MKLKILVIEDDEDLCELLRDWLNDFGQGQDIRTYTNGERALAFLERELAKPASTPRERFIPDLIILDLRLPDQSGLEVLKKLKASPELKSIEVIVNSAAEDPYSLRKTYQYGSCVFIPKDGNNKALLEAIHRLILTGRIHYSEDDLL